MIIIDTHAHLYLKEFIDDVNQVVERAKQAGVAKAILPNIDETTIAPLKALRESDKPFFLSMFGLHPTHVTKNWKNQIDQIFKELNTEGCVGIGEIGIDLYWDQSLKKEQLDAFKEQLKWSAEKNLPVAIHFRNATREVIDCIKEIGASSLRGVFHSFGGNKDELEAIMVLRNFSIGINGVVTFKNSGLAETLARCPKEKIVLETDAPYLSPVPYRGKRNEPAYLAFVVKKLAEIWQTGEIEVANTTTNNALDLFGINDNFGV